jgi:hypothetical protein
VRFHKGGARWQFFPIFLLDYNDQYEVIEIFDGLMRRWDDAVNSRKAAPRRPIGSLTDLPDPGFQRGSSDPSE